ncbi:pyruvate, water dikinase regulatory protein [Desulfuribacillus alkaliarsenatis]|uniref:Putative pyruvate, phosphate dikinase regulatory protein n=1 Tax=Desulfuribacillus alkaliarsenatis TaxID=766136 RepID=A0A1E5G0D7_9FIRM|nr:pyruvate, water dikinase regulatory protein [Desulfuribacillus alkaliarsenatis]OEF96213.1 phosphoenolpyruvate synthase regulatory protein [Desulfuribacillus alkaliarsenatis]
MKFEAGGITINTNATLPVVYVISDSVGETGEFVVRAVASQFNGGRVEIRRIPYVDDKASIVEAFDLAKDSGAFIAYTLVVPEMRAYVKEMGLKYDIPAVDLLGGLMDTFADFYKKQPHYAPGSMRQLDAEYFKKVEAIEFAVKYDDGKDPRGILRADVVLVGISRTSKTPLSMYLAHKRLKVANVPLAPEVTPPEELFMVPKKCIGLIINPEQLNEIRQERLKTLGLKRNANYAKYERILEELEFSEKVMKKIGCPIINVSNKAVEETAGTILDILNKGGNISG